ncbi:helix-turn-helix transcriptional regulator [Ottowia sp. VDI28]|uniref:helix-turn-helix transcriptional regulator n=1 Tax=Ottowia sp. VDI28 TaxID=3133968 RepID=UPI003C2D98A9
MLSLKSTRQALARLHHMASLDTGGVQLIEPLLQELRRVVNFDFGGLLYPGDDGELSAYAEGPLRTVVTDSFDPRILRSEHEVLVRSSHDFAGAVRYEHGPKLLRELVAVPKTEFHRSDFYNVVARPGDAMEYMKLVLRTPQGAGVGAIFLFREAASPWFTADDVAVLARLESHLARALQNGEQDAAGSEVHSQGVLITTPEGRPLWISPEAETLMPLAFGWRWRAGSELPPALQEMLRRLNTPASRTDLATMEPPAMELRTAQGWFSLRATCMAAAIGTRKAAALHITQRVTRGVRLLSALRALDLPQRQHETAWWLMRGLSEPQIAQRMGISINTAVYHRRQLYNRLGVMERGELMQALTRQAPALPRIKRPAQ